MSIEEQIQEFCTTMWRTYSSRFNAQRRMQYRNTMSVFTISILSLYLIAISLVQKIYNISATHQNIDNHLTFVSIVGAVFIIIISLIEWANEFSLKSERLFENANDIRNIRLCLIQSLSFGLNAQELEQRLSNARESYIALTSKATPNHEPIDDLFFRAQNPNEPSKPFQLTPNQRKLAYVRWYFACYGIYVLALALPILFVIFAIALPYCD